MDGQRQAPRRLFALDVLRGLACLLVIVNHMPYHRPVDPGFVTRVADRLLLMVRDLGWSGVDLFFVLSGFLISGLLFKEYDRDGGLRLKRFWLRRGLKIWPCYFVAYGTWVALTVLGGWWKSGALPTEPLVHAIPNVLFAQNYTVMIRWPSSWSLAVEEHFYLALPLVLALLIRCSRTPFRRLPLLVAVVCIFTLAARCLTVWLAGPSRDAVYFPTHLRLDGLALGVLLGYVGQYHRPLLERLARPRLLLAAFALFAFALPVWFSVDDSPLMLTVGFTVLAVASTGLVAIAAVQPALGSTGPAAPVGHVLAWVGVYSYTIYLAQAVVPRLPGYASVCELVAGSVWAERAIYAGASVLLGVLLSHHVERPILRWRERRVPARPTAPPVVFAARVEVAAPAPQPEHQAA